MNEPRRRRPRADAQRNRDKLLAEADAVFRQEGTNASLEGIARRAGVAVGTLYGHFPNRRALIGALLRERNQELFARGEELLAAPDAEDALTRWVYAVVEHAAAYQGLAAVLADSMDDEESELRASCLRMTEIGDQLIAKACAAGVLREDVTSADVFALMNAAAWTREHLPVEQADRLVELTLAGMRTPAA
ncbi:TetR/AcrR family transcriptional regulator [Actinomadura hibisca]|uniref:TetR/AcrR family transcriptional regulator n=1 Tax=Actinomadura hibisca TaxID=68565 RepID=UPI00082F793D|nr:TetR/AcrR family transcriptional regulator [Actinomadura hibisca]